MAERFSKFSRFGEKRGFDKRDDNFEKPINVGEEYDVEITQVGSKGDGIARVKNFVIFVANTKQGEKCKIKITDVRRKFAVAEKISGASKKEEVKEEAPVEAVEEVAEESVEKKTKEKPEKK